MTYDETLEYLYAQLPVYHRIGPAALKNDLSNTVWLCEELGHPERKFKSIHVAGTNGKGSVSSILASILMEAGVKRVGLYTSPHLVDFTERIRLNGVSIPKDWVVNFVSAHDSLLQTIKPSFFEFTVAMCFAYFAEVKVDWAVIEVGLGGRLDSTNVILPALSLITNISLDHTDILGHTLAAIAFEKAGIIKPHIPVVIGEIHAETQAVFEAKAEAEGSPLTYAENVFQAQPLEQALTFQAFDVFQDTVKRYPQLILDLPGSYQQQNLQTALAGIELLRPLVTISDAAVYRGSERIRRNTGLRGRMELLQDKPLVITDVAHNTAGMAQVMKQVAQEFKKLHLNNLHIVVGFVKEKDLSGLLALLPKDAVYYFVKPDLPRGLESEALLEAARSYDLAGSAYGTVTEGLLAARKAAQVHDLVLVTGSLFVVGEVLSMPEYSQVKPLV